MTILMLLEHYYFPPDIRVEKEIWTLNKAGHKVILACRSRYRVSGMRVVYEHASPLLLIAKARIPDIIYKKFSFAALRIPVYFNFWRRFTREILIRHQVDAVHVHDLPLAKVGYEICVSNHRPGKRIKFVLDLHENYPALLRDAPHTKTLMGSLIHSDRQWRRYEQRYVMLADEVIAVCDEAAQRLMTLAPGHPRIIRNTVNLESHTSVISMAKRNGSGPLRLFYGGGINRHRGLQVVIKALQLLEKKNRHVYFDIVGEGSYRRTLETMAIRSPFVKFYGGRHQEEYYRIMSQADAAIIPHLRNENNNASSPNKLFQYMYCNIPVICSDCDSVKKIVEETACGFIYQDDSPERLSELLAFIDDNRELLSRGRAGSKAICDKYNWQKDSQTLLNIYGHGNLE